ncbi:MAG TPA: PAS-domain containing protein, partial [Ramlibacter sp.]
MPQALSELRAVGQALDGIDVGTCVFDDAGRMLVWNQAFLKLFPEQVDGIAVGEPFAATLRRFHPAGIGEAELASLEQYVRDGLSARGGGVGPFSFQLEGRRIEVAAMDIGTAGRVSVWRCLAPDAEPAASGFLADYRLLAELSSDVIALVTDGRIDQVS